MKPSIHPAPLTQRSQQDFSEPLARSFPQAPEYRGIRRGWPNLGTSPGIPGVARGTAVEPQLNRGMSRFPVLEISNNNLTSTRCRQGHGRAQDSVRGAIYQVLGT